MTEAARSQTDTAEQTPPANAALCRFAWYQQGKARDHLPGAPREGTPGQPQWPARLFKLDCGALAVSVTIDGEVWNGRFVPAKPAKLVGPLILYRSPRKA